MQIYQTTSSVSRYLRSELSKQEQSSSEVVRSLLGKSPKKEEKQVFEPVDPVERPIPTFEQLDTKVVMVGPVVKEGSQICEPQSVKAEENTEAEMMQKHVTAQTGSPSKETNRVTACKSSESLQTKDSLQNFKED